MKMTAMRRRRKERQSSTLLDVNKLEEYTNHYNESFRHSPEGHSEFTDQILLSETDPEQTLSSLLDSDQISVGTILTAIKSLPIGKAGGPDHLVSEMFKILNGSLVDSIKILFDTTNRLGTIPTVWRQANLAPIFKNKGSPFDIKSYRPVALTSVFRRLYEKCLLDNLLSVDHRLANSQGGFRHRRSTYDQAFVLHELCQENQESLNAFLDIKTAYDCVDRRILWSILGSYPELSQSYIIRLRALFDHNKSVIVVNGHTSSEMEHNRGLLQGSTLAPLLFNHFINTLIIRLNNNTNKVITSGIRTNNLFFADDANIHASSPERLQLLLTICEQWSQEYGIQFAPNKCAILGEPVNNDDSRPIKIYGEIIPSV